jgi:hypothetical protein
LFCLQQVHVKHAVVASVFKFVPGQLLNESLQANEFLSSIFARLGRAGLCLGVNQVGRKTHRNGAKFADHMRPGSGLTSLVAKSGKITLDYAPAKPAASASVKPRPIFMA